MTMTTKTWKERREASSRAVEQLKSAMENDGYAKVHKQYEEKLASDDPYQSWIAREIVLAYSNKDLPRLVRAKSTELLHIEWLPNRRVQIMWPVPVPLNTVELMILSYRRSNSIYLTEDGLCFGFEVHDRDYFDFCEERRRQERDRPENADNPTS
jgi:hypothetical protein